MMRALLLSISLLMLTACLPQTGAVPSPTPAESAVTPPVYLTVPVTIPVSPTPGLVIEGHVRLANGAGLSNVTICRSFAVYSGEAVATTDANGYFQAAFVWIPGDETVHLWPLAPGYSFLPADSSWEHYYGDEDRSVDFVAAPTAATAVPPAPCK